MTLQERYDKVLGHLSETIPDPVTELAYTDAFQLLVAVILSAQCTDVRVNLVTPALFHAYPDAAAMAKATSDDIFPYIKSISYPNNKAKHLAATARLLMEKHGGNVPLTIEELTALPGVGRKTANVVTSVIDQQPNMAVDTHVFRVAARLGLTVNATTPLAAEKQLIAHIATELVHRAHHWLILFGRYHCTARNPKCEGCGLADICVHYATMAKDK